MKKIYKFILLGLIFLISSISFSQNVNYEVIYNPSTCLYEAHAHVVGGDLSYPNTIPFPSKFSVVVPASISDAPFTVIQSVNPPGISWTNSNNVYAPSSAPTEDFHAFTMPGGGGANAYPTFTVGTDILLFTFSVPHTGCNDGIRCYINGTDPASGAPGMSGIDFTQSFKTFPNTERYLGNIGSPVTLPHPTSSSSYSFLCNDVNNLYLYANANNQIGCGSLNFSWSGPNGFSSSIANPVVNPYTAPGTYNIVVTDANGCTTNSSVSLSQPPTLLSISITSQTNINCYGDHTGSATVSASGGTQPYTYSWNTSPVQITASISNFSAGTYIATVTDANSCTSTVTVDILQPSAALSTSITGTNVKCYGGNTGEAELTVNGGTAPYTYLWSGPYLFSSTDEDITDLEAGLYSVTVTDSKGCQINDDITISEPTQPLLISEIKNNDLTCYANYTGTLKVKFDGGTSPYTFSWTGPNGYTGNTDSIYGLLSGTYTVTVTDYNGCSDIQSKFLGQPNPITANPAPTNISCFGLTNGEISLSVSGGNSGYTYSWTGPNGYSSSIKDITNLAQGTYDVLVTDNKGCTKTATTAINEPSAISVTPTITNASCSNTNDGSVYIDVTGGNPTYTFSWNKNGNPYSNSEDITSLTTGIYALTINDNKGCIYTDSYNITAPNCQPIAENDVNSTSEDTPVSGSVIANDTPNSNGVNTWSLIGINGGAANGTVTMLPNGDYTYTPNPNYNGIDVFNYQLCDVSNVCATATVTITVIPVNDLPLANNDLFTTSEDVAYNGTVTANDTSSGDGGNIWSLVGANGGALHGTVSMNPDGSFTYTPNANYNGTDSLVYQLCDIDNECSTATVNINITPVNDNPVAIDDTKFGPEDNPVTGNVLTNDYDVDGDVLAVTGYIVNGTPYLAGNTAVLTGVGNIVIYSDGSYVFIPDLNWNGNVPTVQYTITDNNGGFASANLNIVITPANDCPIALDDYNTTPEDTPVSGNVLINDSDPDGDPLIVNAFIINGNITLPGNTANIPGIGTIIINTNGSYTFTPESNWNGTVPTITYIADDNNGGLASAHLYITVTPVNDPPVAVNDIETTPEDTPVSGNVITNDNDPDGDAILVTGFVVNGTTHLPGTTATISTIGTIVINANGTFTFTPAPNWNGTVPSIPYSISDGNGGTATANLNITVTPVNDCPVAVNDIISTIENTAVSGNVLNNDYDIDGDALTVMGYIINGNTYSPGSITNITGVGSIVVNSNGTYTFTPLPYWTGNVPNIEYFISDGHCAFAYANLIITVTPAIHYIDLSVTKKLTDPDPLINDTIFKNDTVIFTIVIKNNSSIFNATNIVVLDTIPLGLNYISSTTTNGNYDANTGLWTLTSLNTLDSAVLTMKVKVDTSAENNVYIIAQDNPDTILVNNHSFASVSITSTSSGNDGGLESNGNLASKVALRNFIRHKDRDNRFNDPSKLELFTPESVVSAKANKSQSTELADFIPMVGPTGAPALVTTPTDLIGISNAIEVVSVDYFDALKRKAAILGIASNPNTVYEHTKMVCDRLDGGTLKSINYVTVKGYPFILAGIVQDNGNTDYAVSFIAYKSGNVYTIDNQWDLEQYQPSGSHAVMNFQVWSINEQQTIDLLGKIIDQMISKGYNINYKNSTYQPFPEVYVQNGIYKDGNLELNIINPKGANNVQMKGSRAFVEDGIRYPYDYSTPISASYNSNISIPAGNIFDIGFSMSNNISTAKDVLYFADGPWGREFDENGATITDFSISTQFNSPVSGAFNMGRNANLEGTVKTYASLFRVLRVGNKPINLSNYSKLEFTAFGSGSFEVVISKASISAWNNQYRTTINLDNNNPVTYQIPFSQFADVQGQHNFDPSDVVSVVFIKKGNNSTYQSFVLNVKDMRFINGTSGINSQDNKVSSISVSPNPFNSITNVTFNLNKDQNVKIELYTIDGKVIKTIENKIFNKGINTQIINADDLKAGVYLIKVESESNALFEKIVLMK